MTKVLKCDSSAPADAYVALDLGSDFSEVWATIYLDIETASLATFFPWVIAVFGADGIAPDLSTMLDGASVASDTEWTTFNAIGAGDVEADAWLKVEFGRVTGGNSKIYVNDVLAADGAAAGAGDVRWIAVGQLQADNENTPSVCYVRSADFGVVRGGTSLGSFTFSPGSLSEWTANSGDVSIVDDPIPPPGLVIATARGIAPGSFTDRRTVT